MQFKIKEEEMEINALGVLRWLGQYFTKYKTPADSVLLNNDDYETSLHFRNLSGCAPELKDKHIEPLP